MPNERKHFQQIKREGARTEQTVFQMKEKQLNHCLDVRLIHYTYNYNLEWKYQSPLLTERNFYVIYLDTVAWEAQERASFNCLCDVLSKEYNIHFEHLKLDACYRCDFTCAVRRIFDKGKDPRWMCFDLKQHININISPHWQQLWT